jgi:FKBP-type peptidyl-prolyl cis-trans isomerase 2
MNLKISKRTGLGVAAAAAIMVMMVLPGCLSGPQPQATPAFSMTVIGGGQKAMAGDNLTFIVKIRNNQAVPDAAALTVSFMPADWSVALSCATMEFTFKGSRAIFVSIAIAGNTPAGNYNVKVHAESASKPSATGSAALHVQIIAARSDRVETGNNVKVDYTGYIPDFSVFDTSLKAVGSDLSIPKTASYNAPTDNLYQPLAFEVGKGQMIKGFDAGVLGMMKGQTRTIRVEPRDGYGQFQTTLINMTEIFPMVHNISRLDFTSAYGEEPVLNKVVIEPYWNWEVHVLAVTPENVTLLTLPRADQVSQPYGWETKVIDVNGTLDGGAGRITVRHYPTAGVNATYKGSSAQISAMTSAGVELTYNLASSNPLATQTLFFIVKMVSIQ